MKAVKNTFDMNRINLYEAVPLDTPFQFCIESTFLCNFRCSYCMHSATKDELEKQGFNFASMDWEKFEKILEQLREFPQKIKKIVFSGFGEPLLDKRLPEMIRLIKEKELADKVLVISNGVLLTKEMWFKLLEAGLDEIKISIQGITSEKYKKICGADVNFDDFLEILTFIYKNKGNCIIRIKTVDTALDLDEDVKFYEIFGKICDFISIEHAYEQFSFINYDGKLKPANEKNRFGFNYKKVKICSALFFKLNILQDGRITLGFPDGVTYQGFNIDETTLYNVWNSAERYKFLYDNLKGDYSNRNECKICTRWSYSVVPEDELDGHENEILSRMPKIEVNKNDLRKPVIICGNVNC